MRTRAATSLLMSSLLLILLCPRVARSEQERFGRSDLIEDVRQLVGIIESTHPDPYSQGGGRIAFHRRLHELLRAIPETGMTRDEFIGLLRPFVAAIGDQHTEIYTNYDVNPAAPGGVPFVFGVVDRSLYVLAPFLPDDEKYIGSLLVSVEGIPVDELVQRLSRLEGVENEYYALRTLGYAQLLFEPYLRELVPEWKETGSIHLALKLPNRETELITRPVPIDVGVLHTTESRMELPSTDDSGFLWEFMEPPDCDEEIAYLRVDQMSGYRENFEMAAALGSDEAEGVDLASVPSATESFRSLAVHMKEKGTKTLVVDLRENGGGNYMMAPILVYFLHGKDVLTSLPKEVAASGGGHGQRYSELYFQSYPDMTLETMNKDRDAPLVEGDIDFARVLGDLEGYGSANPHENPERLKIYKRAATFYAEYESEAYSGYYCPENVVVLTSPWTSSSGLDMTLYLYRTGATLVGTPSGQAPNSFGELLEWHLEHSGIDGEVSSSFDLAFGPGSAETQALPVQYPLTYEKLRSYGFDPNAEFLYAVELLPEIAAAR